MKTVVLICYDLNVSRARFKAKHNFAGEDWDQFSGSDQYKLAEVTSKPNATFR